MKIESMFPPSNSARVGIALGLVVFATGGWLAVHVSSHEAVAASEVASAKPGTFLPSKGQLASLKILPVHAMSFRDEQVTDGTIASNDDASTPVFSPFTGRVTRLYAKLGDVVRQGTPLMAVDASEFVQGQSDLIAAVATATSASAQLKAAQSTEKRQHELLLAKAGAQKDWLQGQADLAAAEGNWRTADAALTAARDRLRILGVSEAAIAGLEAASPSPRANPEAIVRAPIAGTVIGRQVGMGQYVQSAAAGAASPVYSIGNQATVWLLGNVRETETGQMKLGQTVEVQVPAWPARVFRARIDWIAPTIDPNTRRLQVRAEIDNHDGALKPLMFASFRIQTGEASTAPGITQEAVVYEGTAAHVFVANRDGSLSLRPVLLGRSAGEQIEVTQGLAVGEKIVTSGALFIDRAAEAD